MQVGIAGAGAIALAYVAFLLENGHHPSTWSPSGKGTAAFADGAPLKVTGAIEGAFQPVICNDVATLARNDVIILALPAYGHRAVLDALLPHIETRHTIIISGHLSFAALYLSKRLSERGIQIPIAAWNTTAVTAKMPTLPNEVRIGVIRKNVDVAVIPARLGEQAYEICVALFGNRFTMTDDLLSIALSNLNPQNHLAIVLCNLTRMELGETWQQNTNITSVVGNLMGALDRERIAIAKVFGKTVRSIEENLEISLGISGSSIAEMYQIQAERGNNPLGPKTINTRYVLEDVPFGLVPTLGLAQMAGIPAPLHKSGVDILSACYAQDFIADNDIMDTLGQLDLPTLMTLVVDGYPMGGLNAVGDVEAIPRK